MKKALMIALVGMIALTSAGCRQNGPGVDLTDTAIVSPVYPEGFGFEDYDSRRAVRNANEVSEDFHSAFDEFSYQTASQIIQGSEKNQLYSPISLYYATALATMGARGTTQEELLDLLGMPDLTSLEEQCGNAYRLMYADNEIAKLKIANSLWLDREANGMEVTFQEPYLNTAKDQFYASVYAVDFSDPKTGDLMGTWISQQTNGTLEYEFDPDPMQIMSILNTIYFYDQWTDRFNEDKTAEDEFVLSNGQTVICDFMNSRYGSHGFVKGEGFTRSALGLKEAGSMVFILPDQGISTDELLSSPERIRSLFESGERQNGEVIWQVPKFSYGTSMKLVDAMKALGVVEAFSDTADFSGLVNVQAFISDIQQKAHIAIDENGVEASAYTEIAVAGAAMPEGRAEMILDRPFIYGIQSRYGDLLFIGICNNPTLE